MPLLCAHPRFTYAGKDGIPIVTTRVAIDGQGDGSRDEGEESNDVELHDNAWFINMTVSIFSS
jgi:hypothetical protein